MEERGRVRVAIIGAGPGGMTAAIYLARAGIECKIFDPGVPGGTVFLVHEIENYPGFPKGVHGRELAAAIEAQVKRFGVEIAPQDVARVEKFEDRFLLSLGSGKQVLAEAVILATGCRPRRLGIKNEARLWGKGVSYCATCDGFFYKGQEVAVIGGGDAAVQEALYLSNICKKVYIIHRRDRLRAKKLHQDRALSKPNIQVLWETVPEEILGSTEVKGLRLRNLRTGEEMELAVSGIFFYIGVDPINEPFSKLLNLTEDGFVKAGEDTKTNVPGIFAVGDIRKKQNRQIVGAISDGCNAAFAAEEYLLEKG